MRTGVLGESLLMKPLDSSSDRIVREARSDIPVTSLALPRGISPKTHSSFIRRR